MVYGRIGLENTKIQLSLVALNASQAEFTVARARSHSLAVLAGYVLSNNNFSTQLSVSMFDTQFESIESIQKKLLLSPPDLLGISIKPGTISELDTLMNSMMHRLDISKTLLVFGHLTATFAYEELLEKYPYAIVVRGEGEEALLKLLHVIQKKIPISDVPNIVYKDSNNNLITTKRKTLKLEDVTSIPVDLINYPGNVGFRAEAGRGCNEHCTFCTQRVIYNNSSQRRYSIERIIREIRVLRGKGVNYILFSDEEFIGEDIDFVISLSKRIIQENLFVNFKIECRADSIINPKDIQEQKVQREMMWNLLKEAGLKEIYLGLESGSPSQLQRYNKQIDISLYEDVIKFLNSRNLHYMVGFIMFDLFVTVDELLENIKFIRENNLLEHIITAFKEIRVQRGSPYEELARRHDLLKELDKENFLYYTAEYKEIYIRRIIQICRPLFKKTNNLAKINWILFHLKLSENLESLDFLDAFTIRAKERELVFIENLTQLMKSQGNEQNIQNLKDYFEVALMEDIIRLKKEIVEWLKRNPHSPIYLNIEKIKELCEKIFILFSPDIKCKPLFGR